MPGCACVESRSAGLESGSLPLLSCPMVWARSGDLELPPPFLRYEHPDFGFIPAGCGPVAAGAGHICFTAKAACEHGLTAYRASSPLELDVDYVFCEETG